MVKQTWMSSFDLLHRSLTHCVYCALQTITTPHCFDQTIINYTPRYVGTSPSERLNAVSQYHTITTRISFGVLRFIFFLFFHHPPGGQWLVVVAREDEDTPRHTQCLWFVRRGHKLRQSNRDISSHTGMLLCVFDLGFARPPWLQSRHTDLRAALCFGFVASLCSASTSSESYQECRSITHEYICQRWEQSISPTLRCRTLFAFKWWACGKLSRGNTYRTQMWIHK